MGAVASTTPPPQSRVKIGQFGLIPLPEASSPPLPPAAIKKHLAQSAVQMSKQEVKVI